MDSQYSTTLTEFKTTERNIMTDLKGFKDTLSSNTVKLEQQIKKALELYQIKLDKLLDEYKKPKIKGELPEKEYNRRVNEITSFRQNYLKLNSEYESILNNKYGYVNFLN
jgi:hypothetical protein